MVSITSQNSKTPLQPSIPLNNVTNTEETKTLTRKIFKRTIKNPVTSKHLHESYLRSLSPNSLSTYLESKLSSPEHSYKSTLGSGSGYESDAELSRSQGSDKKSAFSESPASTALDVNTTNLSRFIPKPPKHHSKQNSETKFHRAHDLKTTALEVLPQKQTRQRQVTFLKTTDDLSSYKDYKALTNKKQTLQEEYFEDLISESSDFEQFNLEELEKAASNYSRTDLLNQTHIFKIQNGFLLSRLGRDTLTNENFDFCETISDFYEEPVSEVPEISFFENTDLTTSTDPFELHSPKELTIQDHPKEATRNTQFHWSPSDSDFESASFSSDSFDSSLTTFAALQT